METGGAIPTEREVEGTVEMMLDATQNFSTPLDEARLFGWHGALFSTGSSGLRKIIVCGWRHDADGPMQVVSGPVGREKVHYEAPAASVLQRDMSAQICQERNDYYAVLERTQKGTLAAVLRKARFWERHVRAAINEAPAIR